MHIYEIQKNRIDEPIFGPAIESLASLVAQMVKNLPEMWETWVQSLGWDDPLEEGMATDSNILAWRIPWATVHGVARVGLDLTPKLPIESQLQRIDLWTQYEKERVR